MKKTSVIRVIVAEFVYSLKTTLRLAKCAVRVSTRLTSVMLAVKTSKVATASRKELQSNLLGRESLLYTQRSSLRKI